MPTALSTESDKSPLSFDGYVGAGHQVSEKCFVHGTVAVVLRPQSIYLSMQSRQQLQQGPKHSGPQKKLKTVTVCFLVEHQPVTLTYLWYMVFCS